MQKLIGGLSALVGGSGSLFGISSRATLLLKYNGIANVVLNSLEVRCKEKFFEYLTNQIFLNDDSVTDRFICLSNNFAC